MHRFGCATLSQLQDRVLHEPAVFPAAARLPHRAGERDVPRPGLLPRAARAGRAAAAHLSVAQDLGRRLQRRRGGLLARDPAARGGAADEDAHLRDRHQPADAAARREAGIYRHRADRGLHRQPPRVGRAAPRSPTTTRPPTAARSSTSRCASTSSSPTTASRPTASSPRCSWCRAATC